MSETSPATRVCGFIARDARIAVLLRRGPSKQVRMIKWHLSSDRLEKGQWLSGRVYPERSSLSPDGELFLYFAGKFKASVDTFTAICRPPWFTALGFWPSRGTWGGGGVFISNREIALGINVKEKNDCRSFPERFIVGSASGRSAAALWPGEWIIMQRGREADTPDPTMRRRYDPPAISARVNPCNARISLERHLVGVYEINGPLHVREFQIVRHKKPGPAVERLGRLDWADWDHSGDLLFSADGLVFRRPFRVVQGSGSAPDVVVADLREDVFTNIPPPKKAREWPETPCAH